MLQLGISIQIMKQKKINIKHGTQLSRTPTAFNLDLMRDVVSLSDKEMVALLDGKRD